MIRWRKVISTIFSLLAAAGSLYADMMPTVPAEIGVLQIAAVHGPADLCRPDRDYPEAVTFHSTSLFWLPTGMPFEMGGETGPAREAQPIAILSDRQNSLTLCLYALFSLGLCKSAPWVRKFSFGVIPQWYHDGGPFQIGHSHAIGPDFFSVTPGLCLVQRDCGNEAPMPQYRHEMTISLWRKSQFTPTVRAPRGPPADDRMSPVI